jgi:hypothetical protein
MPAVCLLSRNSGHVTVRDSRNQDSGFVMEFVGPIDLATLLIENGWASDRRKKAGSYCHLG